jgi:hypothetical protein
MASSSNSSSLAMVTLPKRKKYDVFITFRAEDTRNNFTDYLFDTLHKESIFVFRDDTNLPKGESIGPELLRAIEDSHIFVVVLSKNYASSTWCLQELDKILECVKVSKKFVLPISMMLILLWCESKVGFMVKHLTNMSKDSNKTLIWC